MNPLSEDLLHYLWRTKNFNHNDLTTSDGKMIVLINYGHHNHSDGPDFLNAQIEIEGIKWSGSIEIHIKSSDWIKHGHEDDPNYENTILHVVYEDDRDIYLLNQKSKIPCLQLKDRISSSVINLYHQFDKSKWIPCENLIDQASQFSRILAKEKAITQRLERKWSEVEVTNSEMENNWEETAYRLLARSFGLVHNAEAFMMISKHVPLSIVKKNADNRDNLEAIFYGVAGLLKSDFSDAYPTRLKSNYDFLKKKYGLEESHIRLNHKSVRPQNFPEIALSQFISFIIEPNLVSKILDADLKELKKLLKVSASEYWNRHYVFDQVSTEKIKTVGTSRIITIILNAVVPLYYFMSKKLSDEKWSKRANAILEALPAEKNSVIDKWKERGMTSQSAYDTQALLGLKKDFCDHKACLSCPIGHDIMKSNR